jgi:hypothetical protein
MFMAGFIERAPAFVKSFLQAFLPLPGRQLRRRLHRRPKQFGQGISRTRAGVATALRAVVVLPETVQERTGCGRFATLWASDLGLTLAAWFRSGLARSIF